MKKSIIALLICFSFQIGTSQKIYFDKKNYSDSLTVSKSMPLLAKKLLPIYKNSNKAAFLDSYFRLQFVAGDYKPMEQTLITYAQEILGDSIVNKPVGFAYKTFAKTAGKAPKTNADFEKIYTSEFYKLYNSFDNDGKTWAEGYYDIKFEDIKTSYESKLKLLKQMTVLV